MFVVGNGWYFIDVIEFEVRVGILLEFMRKLLHNLTI